MTGDATDTWAAEDAGPKGGQGGQNGGGQGGGSQNGGGESPTESGAGDAVESFLGGFGDFLEATLRLVGIDVQIGVIVEGLVMGLAVAVGAYVLLSMVFDE